MLIMVCVDGSAGADCAFRMAINRAKVDSDTLVVLSVVEPLNLPITRKMTSSSPSPVGLGLSGVGTGVGMGVGMGLGLPANSDRRSSNENLLSGGGNTTNNVVDFEADLDDANQLLFHHALKLVDKYISLCKELRIKSTGLVKEGKPKEQIQIATKEHMPGLVVMGRRGLSVVRGAKCGSVSEYCARTLSCPVVIVRNSIQEELLLEENNEGNNNNNNNNNSLHASKGLLSF